MTALRAAGATAATVTGAQLVSGLLSPLPLLILGVLALMVWLPIAALLTTPLWSTCPKRNARAAAMLDRVIAAIPGSRDTRTPNPPDTPPDTIASTSPADAPTRPRRRRRRRH